MNPTLKQAAAAFWWPARQFNQRYTDPAISSLVTRVDDRLPSYAERDGKIIKVHTTVGMGHVTRVCHAIPDGAWKRWNGVGIVLTAACLAGVLLAIVLGASYTAGSVVAKVPGFVESVLAQKPPQAPAFSFSIQALIDGVVSFLVGLVVTALTLTLMAVLFTLFYIIAFAIMLPDLVFHEFGHAVAFVKNGMGIKSYGLLFIGPVPMGAFVEPDGSYKDQFDTRQRLEVASAGILHSVGYGAVLVSVGALIGPGLWSYVIGSIGLAHMANGTINAIPHRKLDGGHFVAALLDEYWGFGEAVRRRRLGW